MSKRMPRQQPSASEQNVGTPRPFVEAVARKLRIPRFNWDLAADSSNSVCEDRRFFSKEDDAFTQDWSTIRPSLPFVTNWSWLNPPFKDIYPWTEKCLAESERGAYIAMLVPAATDTAWYNDHVHGYAYVLLVRGRFAFVGHKQSYPKGLAVVLFTPQGFNGYDIWAWREQP